MHIHTPIYWIIKWVPLSLWVYLSSSGWYSSIHMSIFRGWCTSTLVHIHTTNVVAQVGIHVQFLQVCQSLLQSTHHCTLYYHDRESHKQEEYENNNQNPCYTNTTGLMFIVIVWSWWSNCVNVCGEIFFLWNSESTFSLIFSCDVLNFSDGVLLAGGLSLSSGCHICGGIRWRWNCITVMERN